MGVSAERLALLALFDSSRIPASAARASLRTRSSRQDELSFIAPG